jgi:hypothetical protein
MPETCARTAAVGADTARAASALVMGGTIRDIRVGFAFDVLNVVSGHLIFARVGTQFEIACCCLA